MNPINGSESTGFEKAQARRNLFRFLVPSKRVLFGIALFSFSTNLLMLTAPLYMLQVYDRVLTSRSQETLLVLFLLVTGLYAAQAVIDYNRGRLLARLGERLDGLFAEKMFAYDMKNTIEGSDKNASPLTDLARLRRFMTSNGPASLLDTPWVPVYLLVLASLHIILGFVGLVGAIVVVSLAYLADRATRTDLQRSAQIDASSGRLHTMSTNAAEVVSVLGMEGALANRFAKLRHKGIVAEASSGNRGAVLTSVSRGFRLFLQSTILTVGAVLAIQQEISGGVMIAGSIILGRSLAPIDQIVGQWRTVAQARSAFDRLALLLGRASDGPAPFALPKPRGRLVVTDLASAPAGCKRPVIAGISFSLEPGDGLGIIGPSGAGKSTLARALIGITKPLAGKIEIDGASLSQWSPEALGRHIGYLPQDAQLIGDTVADCIARLDPEAQAEDIVQAATDAGAHEMILGLAEGYGTKIGDGGSALSGGQRRRIALARALYGEPVLIVLDEPNSQLDREGDNALVYAIHKARARGAVVIVVTHRQSAVAAVDSLLLMKNGTLAGLGKKQAVMQQIARPARTNNVVQQ